MTVTWSCDGTAPPVASSAPSTPSATALATVDYPHIVHSSLCSTSTLDNNQPDAPQLDACLQPVDIFKLAYALSLAGRFIFELNRFLGAVRSDTGLPSASSSAHAVYRETCLLLQGFYQVSSDELPLPQRINRIWLACRTFFFRGMIATVDNKGLPVGPSAPVRLNPRGVPRDESEGDSAKDSQTVSSSGPTFSAADIPTVMSTRCNIELPPAASFASRSSDDCDTSTPDSELFMWASAGCLLGKHCVNVAELPLATMGLADMTDAVAQLEARLQCQDRRAIAAAAALSGESGEPGQLGQQSDAGAGAGHRKRVWCPVMMHGPPDKIIVDLCRRLELKEQQYRAMLHKFCHFEEEERQMEAQARAEMGTESANRRQAALTRLTLE